MHRFFPATAFVLWMRNGSWTRRAFKHPSDTRRTFYVMLFLPSPKRSQLALTGLNYSREREDKRMLLNCSEHQIDSLARSLSMLDMAAAAKKDLSC
jgi:hypothetical protein